MKNTIHIKIKINTLEVSERVFFEDEDSDEWKKKEVEDVCKKIINQMLKNDKSIKTK